MFAWIGRMFQNASGLIDNTVRNWVHDLINGLYGFLHAIFGDVNSAWTWIFRRTTALWHSAESVGLAVWNALAHLFRIIIPAIIAEYRKLFNDALNFARTVYQHLLSWVDFLRNLILTGLHQLTQWVIDHIWNPIWQVLTEAWNWITHEGQIVFGYISHPDKLVDLIWDALLARLEKDALVVADRLGKFVLTLIIKQSRQIALLIEDIFTSVL